MKIATSLQTLCKCPEPREILFDFHSNGRSVIALVSQSLTALTQQSFETRSELNSKREKETEVTRRPIHHNRRPNGKMWLLGPLENQRMRENSISKSRQKAAMKSPQLFPASRWNLMQ
jgi:hypothetical protein